MKIRKRVSIYFLALLPALISARAALATEPPAVRLLDSRSCGPAQCHQLEVRCAGLPPRPASLREYPPAEGPSQGTLVLTTGVWGNKPYDEKPERRATLEAARQAGFEVFELWWPARHGWGHAAEGAGFIRALCAPGAVIRWLVAERADAPGRVCAQGNSGGALQIAYGLSFYELGDTLHLAVLSGGPPLVDIAGYCFDRIRERAKMWRENGRRIIDTLHGWDGNGDHCKNGDPDPAAVESLNGDALPSPGGGEGRRDPGTRVVFVESEGDKSTRQARLYHDALEAPKRWLELPGKAHGVDRTPETAAVLRRVLLEECAAVGSDGAQPTTNP